MFSENFKLKISAAYAREHKVQMSSLNQGLYFVQLQLLHAISILPDKAKPKLNLQARIKGTISTEVYLDYMKYDVDRILRDRKPGSGTVRPMWVSF